MSDYYHEKRRMDDKDDVQQYMIDSKAEPDVCKHFGCGKHLSLEEKRCGDRCRDHSIKKEVDIVNLIKIK